MTNNPSSSKRNEEIHRNKIPKNNGNNNPSHQGENRAGVKKNERIGIKNSG